VVTGVLVFVSADVPLRLGLDRAIAGRLLRFGLPLAASLGVEAVLLNADYIIVGHVLGTAAVGYYMIAFNVSSWVPGLIGTAVRYVSVAGFSRLAEQDVTDTSEGRDAPDGEEAAGGRGATDSLSAGVRRSMALLIAFVLPVAVVMATLASPLLIFLYGERWAPSAVVLNFLAVLMVVRMLTSLAFDVLTSAGATGATVWLNLGWVAALVPALLAAVHLDGIRGVGIGHAVVGALVALPLTVAALRRSGVRLGPMLPSLVRPVLGAASAAVVIVALSAAVTRMTGHPAVELSVAGGAGVLLYVLVVVPRDQIRRVGGRLIPTLVPKET
jgi:PST family polysaccharide transporter